MRITTIITRAPAVYTLTTGCAKQFKQEKKGKKTNAKTTKNNKERPNPIIERTNIYQYILYQHFEKSLLSFDVGNNRKCTTSQ